MSETLDMIRELLDRQAAPCTGPVCAGEEYHMCDFGGDWSDFGQCCDSCDMAQAAAGGLRILYDKHFGGLLVALEGVLPLHQDGVRCWYCSLGNQPDADGIHFDKDNVWDGNQRCLDNEEYLTARDTLITIAADAKVALTACAKPGEEHYE